MLVLFLSLFLTPTKDVCVFVDKANDLAPQQVRTLVRQAFNGCPVKVNIHYEEEVELNLSQQTLKTMQPSTEEVRRLSHICSHHSLKLILSGLPAKEAFKTHWTEGSNILCTTGIAMPAIGVAVVYQSSLMLWCIRHEWTHLVLGYEWPHSPDQNSCLFYQLQAGQKWLEPEKAVIIERLGR